jgi:hypothetical protein
MSYITITIAIDPKRPKFRLPAPDRENESLGNFDPIRYTKSCDPANVIKIVQPHVDSVTGYDGGSITISAPLGLPVSIDFVVTDNSLRANPYWICGIVLAPDGGSGTGRFNFGRHSCSDGKLTLVNANVLNRSYSFSLLIQDPDTSGIALVDPRIRNDGT